MSDPSVFALIHKLFYPLLSPCPVEDGEWDSGVVDICQPAKVNPTYKVKNFQVFSLVNKMMILDLVTKAGRNIKAEGFLFRLSQWKKKKNLLAAAVILVEVSQYLMISRSQASSWKMHLLFKLAAGILLIFRRELNLLSSCQNIKWCLSVLPCGSKVFVCQFLFPHQN